LSYPLFLLHWPLGALAAGLLGLKQGLTLFLLGGALAFSVAILVLWFIEDPLVRLREAIRKAEPEPSLEESVPAISD
jgi:peptidoglycan/LPS O-acetylase OafA/YrhL